MPRRAAVAVPSYFHVLNRAVRRSRIFDKPGDYAAFLLAVRDAQQRVPMGLLAYCVMPNHFHLVVGPAEIRVLSRFMHRLTVLHSKRWHAHHGTHGTGPVYQGRFKAYPIRDEVHFLFVCRYVERNPLRADLVGSARQWPWSSLSRDDQSRPQLSPWPVPRPRNWLEELDAIGSRNRVS